MDIILTTFKDGGLMLQGASFTDYQHQCANRPPKAAACHFFQSQEGVFFRHLMSHNYTRPGEPVEVAEAHQFRFGRPMPLCDNTIDLFRFTKAVEAIAYEALRLPEKEIVFRLPSA